jgi:hypothetical protein
MKIDLTNKNYVGGVTTYSVCKINLLGLLNVYRLMRVYLPHEKTFIGYQYVRELRTRLLR